MKYYRIQDEYEEGCESGYLQTAQISFMIPLSDLCCFAFYVMNQYATVWAIRKMYNPKLNKFN